jgi:predicted Zn-ribbon and HTH transcriptional regulator
MKIPSMSASAATALRLLQRKDPVALELLFRHLTPSNLAQIQDQLGSELEKEVFASVQDSSSRTREEHCNQIIAQALVRRLIFACLRKYSEISSRDKVEDALKHHILPESLQLELAARYGGKKPRTWYDALEQLRKIAADERINLWELLLDHPMTAYIPMQCQSCGHVVPDDLHSGLTDVELGLAEVDPTPEEAPLVRAGWFRGPRHLAKVFVLNCPECGAASRWFRSRDPTIILNPNKWGRLCGEQEDLRLDLAHYLNIPIRTCIAVDWDHVWSEYLNTDVDEDWIVHDDSTKNFAVRLDEGLGSWTGVLAIHPDPNLCEDVTEQYLSCQSQGGRADDHFAPEIYRYQETVANATKDASGSMTQAGTVVGYALRIARFNSTGITEVMRKAARDYGNYPWYHIQVESET